MRVKTNQIQDRSDSKEIITGKSDILTFTIKIGQKKSWRRIKIIIARIYFSQKISINFSENYD
jgi:hypothetical protein